MGNLCSSKQNNMYDSFPNVKEISISDKNPSLIKNSNIICKAENQNEVEKKKLEDFHKETKKNQNNYFSENELIYYTKKLKLESQIPSKSKIIKKKIKCREDHHLGSGSFGTVTRGYDLNNQIIMAVKKIFIGKNEQSLEKAKEIHQEIKILKKLNHQNIVQYYGSQTQNQFVKIYLEFVDMGSITSLIKTYGNLKTQTVANFTKQILDGLEYLHFHNIIHRDIKGDNIFVSNEGVIKLGDFGSAKKVDKHSFVKSVIGTVCWMAPEILEGNGYGRAADIWSLGCTVYEMLMGVPPFIGKNHFQTSKLIMDYTEGSLNWKGIGELEKDFIGSCLKIDPLQRYNVKKLLNHPFIKNYSFIDPKMLNTLKKTEADLAGGEDRKSIDKVNKILNELNKKKKEIKIKRLFNKRNTDEKMKDTFQTPKFSDI